MHNAWGGKDQQTDSALPPSSLCYCYYLLTNQWGVVVFVSGLLIGQDQSPRSIIDTRGISRRDHTIMVVEVW